MNVYGDVPLLRVGVFWPLGIDEGMILGLWFRRRYDFWAFGIDDGVIFRCFVINNDVCT